MAANALNRSKTIYPKRRRVYYTLCAIEKRRMQNYTLSPRAHIVLCVCAPRSRCIYIFQVQVAKQIFLSTFSAARSAHTMSRVAKKGATAL
jgi:hypothetical protein